MRGSATASVQKSGAPSCQTTRPPATAASSPNATRPLDAAWRPWPVMEIQTTRPTTGHELGGVDAELLEGPGAAGLDHHVGLSDEAAKQRRRPGDRRSRAPPSASVRSADRRRWLVPGARRRVVVVDSTLTTVAPAPASRSPQSGPAHRAERSTTTSPRPARVARCARAGHARRRAVPPLHRGAPREGRAVRPRSSSSSACRVATALATARHRAGSPAGDLVELEPGGHGPWSSARGSETAMKPSVEGSRRQLPPQLVAPRRHSPMSAARSPRSASGSRPGRARGGPAPRYPRPGRSGGPRGWSGSPVSAMAPLAAQRSHAGDGGSVKWAHPGRVTSRHRGPPQCRGPPGRAARRHRPRAERRGRGPPRAAGCRRRPGDVERLASLPFVVVGVTDGSSDPGWSRLCDVVVPASRPGARVGSGQPRRAPDHREHAGPAPARPAAADGGRRDWWRSRWRTRCCRRVPSSPPGVPGTPSSGRAPDHGPRVRTERRGGTWS